MTKTSKSDKKDTSFKKRKGKKSMMDAMLLNEGK
jgi:hypothetical protein